MPSASGLKKNHIKATVEVLLHCSLKCTVLFPYSETQVLGFIFGGNLNPSKRERESPNLLISILTHTVHTIILMRGSCMLWPLYASYTDKETVQGNNFDREGFIWQHLSSTASAFPFQDLTSSSTLRMMVEEGIRE